MARRQWGSIKRLPSNRYQASYLLNGVRYNAPTTFSTKADADLFLATQRKLIEDGTWRQKNEGNQPFGPFALQWLESKKGQQIRQTTFEDYERHIRLSIIPKWGSRPIKSIKHTEVQIWLNTLSSGSARKIKSTMSQVMTEAIRNEIINVNPCDHTKVKRNHTFSPNIIDAAQFQAIRKEVGQHYDLFVATLFIQGVRFGEACALEVRHILENQMQIANSVTKVRGGYSWTPTKTYETRIVSMPNWFAIELRNHIESKKLSNNDLLFTTPNGKLIDNRNFNKRVWKPAMERLVHRGVLVEPILIKDLRASCASIVADKFGIVEASRRLGHSKSNLTAKHYARAIAGRDNQVAQYLGELVSEHPKLAVAN